MNIEIKRTTELNSNEWEIYTSSFNQVFNKIFTIDDFKQKYLTTIDGLSYHSLLMQDELIVGGCTVIPFEYFIKNTIVRVGLAVDVFILDTYRSHPMILYQMYNKLKKSLTPNKIEIVIAVPNDTAFSYWKNIIKWKEVGLLNYNVLPVKLGNVISKLPAILNIFSFFGYQILLCCSYLFHSTERISDIRINRTNRIIEKQRYTAEHKKIILQDAFFGYRIVNEEGIIACYLIDFYNTKKLIRDSYSLNKAIRYICSNEKVDLIIFIGKLTFSQILLIKVPFKSEPRHLHFMIDIIIDDNIKDIDFVYNINNWDFGLFNYDVR